MAIACVWFLLISRPKVSWMWKLLSQTPGERELINTTETNTPKIIFAWNPTTCERYEEDLAVFW